MISRYQTAEMTRLWSQEATFGRWTQIEIEACEVMAARGAIPPEDMGRIRTARPPTAERVREIEAETNHDVVAFVRALGELVGEPARRHLHKGLTSSDVVDTALGLALRDSLQIVVFAVSRLQEAIGVLADRYRATPCAGRTHGIHAEPTTFGLRLAGWYAELERHIERLGRAQQQVAFGKLSGAVGTFSQTDPGFERDVLMRLSLRPEPVATQVVPRDRHAEVVSALALLGAGLERFAVEIRALQRTDVGEAGEPFAEGQTGSSAMPHKRNPIVCERITGMARLLRGYLVAAFEDVALWHDRDISHSSVERVMLPDAFHLAHYMVLRFTEVIEGLRVDERVMAENLEKTRGMIYSQTVLGDLLDTGLDRTEAYKMVQDAARAVWDGRAPHFREALAADPRIGSRLGPEALARAFDPARCLRHVDHLMDRAGVPRHGQPGREASCRQS